MLLMKIFIIILAYLVGSIPFGLIIGKLKGIDIREFGSKNIGATNTGRVLGRQYALIAFFLDAIKGGIFVFLFRFGILPDKFLVLSPALYGFLAVLGHTFPIYLKFKGGKAVSTSGGFIIGYCPWLIVPTIFIFLLTVAITKMVSLGSLLGTLFALIGALTLYLLKIDPVFGLEIDIFFPIFIFLSAAIIYVRHIPNIKRIINKTESKVSWI